MNQTKVEKRQHFEEKAEANRHCKNCGECEACKNEPELPALFANGSIWTIEVRKRKEHDGKKVWILRDYKEVASVDEKGARLRFFSPGFTLSSIPEKILMEAENLFSRIMSGQV